MVNDSANIELQTFDKTTVEHERKKSKFVNDLAEYSLRVAYQDSI
jgi:hypothetical protein